MIGNRKSSFALGSVLTLIPLYYYILWIYVFYQNEESPHSARVEAFSSWVPFDNPTTRSLIILGVTFLVVVLLVRALAKSTKMTTKVIGNLLLLLNIGAFLLTFLNARF